MAILPASQDYSDKDFEALRARLFSLIRSVFPDWSNDSVANFGNILVEAFCFCGDVLCFYQDQQAREGRFAWVQMRRNMIALCKLIGYRLRSATAATGDVRLRVSNAAALTGTVAPIATPVVVRTNEITAPVRGELQGAVSFDIAGGEVEKVFPWKHCLTQPAYAVAASGRADQRVLLPNGPFLDSSEAVSTPTQGTFARVDSFLTSGPLDLVYRVEVDQNDRAEVIFGDGRNGALAVGTISIAYQTGGGLAGDLEPNALRTVEGSFRDTAGTPAYIEVVSSAGMEGGNPREEVEAARVNAPESLRALTRTVCREDFEINAKRVDGVGRALMLTSNEDLGVEENSGLLFILPTTGGVPSQAMLDAVYLMCTATYPSTVTFRLEVRAVVYRAVNVRAVVWFREGAVRTAVRDAIVAALADFFSPLLGDGTANPAVDFGWNYKDEDGNPAGSIAWSDIFNAVRDTAGVRKVDPDGFLLSAARDDVAIPNYEFPALGTVTVIDGATGAQV